MNKKIAKRGIASQIYMIMPLGHASIHNRRLVGCLILRVVNNYNNVEPCRNLSKTSGNVLKTRGNPLKARGNLSKTGEKVRCLHFY
jgi:hypothetical protein